MRNARSKKHGPAPTTRKNPSCETVNISVKLVTHQFGGGAVARQVDEQQWLRAPAVRGALRTWWRAIYAGGFEDLDELHENETRLFGGPSRDQAASGPGRFSVVVADGQLDPRALQPWQAGQGDALNVAYFPAEQRSNAPAARLLDPNGAAPATITLRPDASMDTESWDQIRTALQAYLLFGGSGSRTRRAAGSIVPSSQREAEELGLPATPQDLQTWRGALPADGTNHGIFQLFSSSGVYLTPHGRGPAVQAQRDLLEMWREFRQDRPHPRNWGGAAGWGRSRWPEADALRHLAGTHARWTDGTDHAPIGANIGKAPRAHLGLPIIVKFKDDRTGRHHPTRGMLQSTDPQTQELVGASANGMLERYASPVLLSVAKLDNRYRGLVLITPSTLNCPIGTRSQLQPNMDPGSWSAVDARLRQLLRSQNFIAIQ